MFHKGLDKEETMNKKIAITGGIGSGKSTVLKILREKGYSVFSCDEIYADVIKSKEYVEKINKIFPLAVKNGVIDRKNLSDEVFSDKDKRLALNQIAHPLIMKSLYENINERLKHEKMVFAEVPLLFENGFEKDFDAVIILSRDTDKRVSCVKERSGLSEEEILKRISAQFDYDNYFKNINFDKNKFFILTNNLKVVDLENALLNVLEKTNQS